MALINQFNTDQTLINLLQRHMDWHMGSRNGSMGSSGSGTDFLQFHRTFINDFFAWNNSQGNPIVASAIAAWTSIPQALKNTSLWNQQWEDAETRLTNRLNNFATEDDLGIFIEGGIHNNFLHSAAAQAFGDTVLTGFESPRSTYFYQIHGLVQHWWDEWQRQRQSGGGSNTGGNSGNTGGGTTGCFIATAALGNYQHPTVILLSQFRDEFLLTKKWGQQFVKNYYRFAPPFAKAIEKNNWLRIISYYTIVKPLAVIVKILLKK